MAESEKNFRVKNAFKFVILIRKMMGIITIEYPTLEPMFENLLYHP